MTVDTDRVDEVLLDQQLSTYEARQFAAVVVDAPADRAYAAVRALDPDQVARSFPPMRALGWLRALPAQLAAGLRRDARQGEGRLPAAEANNAFVVLADDGEAEFVVGMVGKFMTPTQLEFRQIEPGAFRTFAEPGYGKVALNFRVRPYGQARSLLSTETRTVTTDPESRERFRRYWQIVGPFAGLIMRRWLRLAKRHAETSAGPPAFGGSADSRSSSPV
jgi:hypothetical protein